MGRKRRKRYSEKEMTAIFERAAKLHEASALVPISGGRTRDEIRAIATEAGMDAAAVDAAVDSLDEEELPHLPVIGRSPRMEFTSTFEGELDEEDRRELLGIVKRALDAKGRERASGDVVEWRTFGLLGRETVAIATRKGKTRLEIRGRYRRGFVASFASGGLAGGAAAAGLLDLSGLLHLLDAGAVPLVMAAAFFSGRAVWGWLSGIKERALRRLADRLADVAEDDVAAGQRALPPPSDE